MSAKATPGGAKRAPVATRERAPADGAAPESFVATSGLSRTLRFAGMTAGVAGSYLGYLAQRAFLGEEKAERRRKATHAAVGRRMRDELLRLRGPAMKLGQALSLNTGDVPEEIIAELTKLQMEAPGMHPALVRAQVRASLGRAPEEIFARFTPEPFAAASLGQVHRALTREGEEVAVKIQYPGIRAAIENDFRWLRSVSMPVQLSGHVPKGTLGEIETQILAETDYRREADNIAFFAAGLRPLSFVTVPRVHREYSSDRVLTMSVVPGRHLDAFLAGRPSQALRDLVGCRLFELFHFQFLALNALHADPHWGNYLFTADGAIGLVDFGCVKHFGADAARRRKAFLYRGRLDSAEFRELATGQFLSPGRRLPPAMFRAIVAFAERFYRKVYPPFPDNPPPFDFSDAEFLRDYAKAMLDLFRVKGGTDPAAVPYTFLVRAEIGLYQTLHRLRARVPTSEILRRLLADAGGRT